MVLRPDLTGVLFDLIVKFREALALSLYRILVSLSSPPFFLYIISAAFVHVYADLCS